MTTRTILGTVSEQQCAVLRLGVRQARRGLAVLYGLLAAEAPAPAEDVVVELVQKV